MRTERQHQIDCAIVRSLREVNGRLVVLPALRFSVERKLDHLRPSTAEIDEAVRYQDREGRILGIAAETGTKYKLTEAGEAWALENNL